MMDKYPKSSSGFVGRAFYFAEPTDAPTNHKAALVRTRSTLLGRSDFTLTKTGSLLGDVSLVVAT